MNLLSLYFRIAPSHPLRPSAALHLPSFCPSVFCSNEWLPCGRFTGWGSSHQVPFTATWECVRTNEAHIETRLPPSMCGHVCLSVNARLTGLDFRYVFINLSFPICCSFPAGKNHTLLRRLHQRRVLPHTHSASLYAQQMTRKHG